MFPPVSYRSNILMLLVSTLLVTANEELNRSKTLSKIQASDIDDDAGESRASGGVLADPSHHPWIGTAWQKPHIVNAIHVDYGHGHNDGFLAGHSIALPGDHHILHKGTGQDIINAGRPHDGHYPKKTFAWAQHPAEAKVNVMHGPQTGKEFDISQPKHIKDLGSSPFALYNHNKGEHTDVPYPGRKPITKFPTLEHDKNNFGTDCHAHIWSDQPVTGSRSDLRPVHSDERHYVKIPVNVDKNKCKSTGECQITAGGGIQQPAGFCRGPADRGAPVICGKEQKLTYLLAPNPLSRCSASASGYHVGHLIPHINAHDSKILG